MMLHRNSACEVRVMETVDWTRSAAGFWYPFETFDFTRLRGSGVYIIWYDAEPPAVVCVGHGMLAQRLSDWQHDRGVLMYRQFGPLCATWAHLLSAQQQGVARYLTEHLRPAFGDTLLLVPPIPVLLPAFAHQLEHIQ